MAKPKKRAKRRVTAKRKRKVAKPAAKRKKPATKLKKKVKSKRKVARAKKKRTGKAAAETARLTQQLRQWQALHAGLQEQIRAKENTIAMQMQEIMELKRDLEQLTSPSQE